MVVGFYYFMENCNTPKTYSLVSVTVELNSSMTWGGRSPEGVVYSSWRSPIKQVHGHPCSLQRAAINEKGKPNLDHLMTTSPQQPTGDHEHRKATNARRHAITMWGQRTKLSTINRRSEDSSHIGYWKVSEHFPDWLFYSDFNTPLGKK